MESSAYLQETREAARRPLQLRLRLRLGLHLLAAGLALAIFLRWCSVCVETISFPAIAILGFLAGIAHMGLLALERSQDREWLQVSDALLGTQAILGILLVGALRLAGYQMCPLCIAYWVTFGLQMVEMLVSRRKLPVALAWLALFGLVLAGGTVGWSPLRRAVALMVPLTVERTSGPRTGATFSPAAGYSGDCLIVTQCAPCFAARAAQSLRDRVASRSEFRVYALKGADLSAVKDLTLDVRWVEEQDLKAIGMTRNAAPAWVTVFRGRIRSQLGGGL